MRVLPAPVAAQLSQGVSTLAHVWRVTRRDGEVFGFTDHDQDLTFAGLACAPAQALVLGAIEKSLGLAPDSASFSGALAAALSEAELSSGLWDGARVDVYRVNWSDPSGGVHLFAGRIGEVKRGVQAFEAELRGLQAPFNVAVGRVFSRFCDADLGDARCGKSIATPAFRGVGVVSAVIASAAFVATGLGAFVDGWFTRGRLVWDEGGEGEVSAHRLSGGGVTLELLDAPGAVLEPGAGFTIYAGCDKRHETCRLKFDNALNFRGFPHMPGNDAVQTRPIEGQDNDGGSRWR